MDKLGHDDLQAAGVVMIRQLQDWSATNKKKAAKVT